MIRYWLRVPLLAALLCLIFLTGTVRTAYGLSCASLTPLEMLEKAQEVALARVTYAAAPIGLWPDRPQPVVLEVERVFKGDLGRRIVVMHTWMVGPDIRLEPGQRYLLFLNRRVDGSRRTSLCSGTMVMPGALPLELAEVLGEGDAPRGADDPLPFVTRASMVPAWVWVGAALLLSAGLVRRWRRRR